MSQLKKLGKPKVNPLEKIVFLYNIIILASAKTETVDVMKPDHINFLLGFYKHTLFV